MATERPKLNLYQKLLEIQKKINGLGKDKSGGQFRYVTGDKVLEHLKPLMNDLGLLLKQEVISIENTRQDYKTRNGEASEINSKVMMKFTWIDAETGDRDENLFGANGQNAWDKGVGSALTYGERYFLLKYFHIATDEDDIDNPERKPADAQTRESCMLNLNGFKGLYSASQHEAMAKRINTLTAAKADDTKKSFGADILDRLKKERTNLHHTASQEQLDLIDKTLLSHVFTIDEKQGYNTANYEYDTADATNRIDFLLTALKARKQPQAAAA